VTEARILLIHGGTKRVQRLTQLIESRGFSTTVAEIPWETTSESEYNAVIFAGGLIRAGSHREIKRWSRRFIRNTPLPLLGICLGHLLLGIAYGATYRTLPHPEYGSTAVKIESYPLAPRITDSVVWEDHIHELVHLPPLLRNYASSETTKIQAIKHVYRDQFGVQFHPEAEEGSEGLAILEGFLNLALRRQRKPVMSG
jgi:para-aminobenzoate synthetase